MNVSKMNCQGKRRQIIIAAVMVAVFIFVATATAQQDFFAKLFLSETQEVGVSLTDTLCVSLDNGSIIVDTDALKIEVIDTIKSGQLLKVGVLVTLKELDTAMRDRTLPTMQGYRFGNIQASSLSADAYYYASTYSELSKNQFLAVLECDTGLQEQERLGFSFKSIGYYNKAGNFVPYITASWNWSADISGTEQTGLCYTLDMPMTAAGHKLTLKSLALTGLGCIVVCTPEEAVKDDEDIRLEILQELQASFAIIKLGGESLPFRITSFEKLTDDGAWEGEFCSRAIFEIPTSPTQIDSISYGGVTLLMSP